MSYLNMIIESELCINLLSALLHSLWQGLIIAGILLLYLRSKSAHDANTRYTASLIALSSILICLLFTWSILNYEPAPTVEENTVTNASLVQKETIAAHSQTNEPAITHTETQNTSASFNWKPPVIGLWLTGVFIMLFRAIYIIAGGAKLQVQCDELKDERILEIIEKLRKNLRITRKIKVAVSEYVTVPGVVGFFKPILLLPVLLITGVPDEALQAILAHELAHIRRYDYLVNFCQMVIEAILFFNPAVWWISRQIRIEREVCCDNAGIASIGRRIRYAEVLIGWAQKMKERDMETVEVAMGFGKQSDNSGMLERIKRIVSIDHRPGLKVSWHIAAITLILSIATLAALWQGTNATVAFAGKLLTPQERIDKITEISKEYGFEKREYGPEDKIKISGTVRTFDGKPLPARTFIRTESNRPGFGASSSQDLHKSNPSSDTGTFKASVEFGQIYVTASNDNYAPAIVGPFNVEPGGTIENIELILEQGFKAKIKVVDEKGNPIESVKLTGGHPIEGSWSHSIILTTDVNGIAIVEHAINREVNINIQADGFEAEQFSGITLDPDKIKTLMLKSSPATTGIVLSKETGKPIQGAEVRIIQATGNHSTNGMEGEPETVTDENGRFILSKLRSDNKYLIFISAEGYSRQYLSYVTAGQNDLKAELGPKKNIKGKITGDLSKLGKDKHGVPTIWYWQRYGLGHFSHSNMQEQTQVTIKDGIGYFQIDDCWGQSVNIQAAGKYTDVDIEKDSLNDVIIEISPESEKREVILKFITPEGYPSVTGGVRIDYVQPDENGYHPEWLEITNSQAHYEIPVPCKFKYKIDFIQGRRPVGYWFNEKEVEVTAGKEPLILEVPVDPAGTIYGNILNPDGTMTENAHGSLRTVKQPKILSDQFALSDILNNSGNDKGKYNASPLPLDGQYQMVIYSGNSFILTDPVTLTQANPIVEQNVQLAKGITLKGKLLDIDGTPARDYVRFHVSVSIANHSWGTTLDRIRPDENGMFSIENVNPDFEGKYSIIVEVRNGYRPTQHEIKDPRKPVTVQLEKGLRATGIILDEETGWPIPGVKVQAYCVYEKGNSKVFSDYIDAESPTNDKGEFVFSNMTENSYTLSFSGLRATKSYKITGGQKDSVIVHAGILERSQLKPRKPD